VVTAWYKAIAQKAVKIGKGMGNKIRRIFRQVHAVMTHKGADTLEESKRVVRKEFDSFIATLRAAGEEDLADYFVKQWGPNIGAHSPPRRTPVETKPIRQVQPFAGVPDGACRVWHDSEFQPLGTCRLAPPFERAVKSGGCSELSKTSGSARAIYM
jgi:hypothetical protein